MFFDFNYDYSPSMNSFFGGKPCADAGIRIQTAVLHAIEIPAKILSTIVEIAKLCFLAIACALAGGQAQGWNTHFIYSAKNLGMMIPLVGSCILGVFAPMNARDWNDEIARMRISWC